MSGEGGAGMEGPRGDFVRQFGDPDRIRVNNTPKTALKEALLPQNIKGLEQRYLGSENIRKATDTLDEIVAVRERLKDKSLLGSSQKQSESSPEPEDAPEGPQVEPKPAKKVPEPPPAIAPTTGSAVPAEGASTAPEAEKPETEEEAQAEGEEEVSGDEDETEEVPLTEKEKPVRGKMAEKIVEHLDRELENKSKNTENHNEKAIFDALRDRWKGDAGAKRLKEDFERLKTNSPEQLMRELLKERMMYGKKVYTDVEIDALLVDKSEGSFYKTMEPEVVLQVLQRKILEGGLTKKDVLSIENAQWTRDAVEQAFQKNEEAQKLVKEIVAKEEGKGIEKHWKNAGEFRKKFWEQVKKHPWIFVMALGLTGIPGVVVAYTALSAKEKG